MKKLSGDAILAISSWSFGFCAGVTSVVGVIGYAVWKSKIFKDDYRRPDLRDRYYGPNPYDPRHRRQSPNVTDFRNNPEQREKES